MCVWPQACSLCMWPRTILPSCVPSTLYTPFTVTTMAMICKSWQLWGVSAEGFNVFTGRGVKEGSRIWRRKVHRCVRGMRAAVSPVWPSLTLTASSSVWVSRISLTDPSLFKRCLIFFFYLNLVTNSVKNWYRTSINFRAVSIFFSMIRKDKVTTFKPYFEVFLGKLT